MRLPLGVRDRLGEAPARGYVRLDGGKLLIHVLVNAALFVHIKGRQVIVRHQQRAYVCRALAGAAADVPDYLHGRAGPAPVGRYYV